MHGPKHNAFIDTYYEYTVIPLTRCVGTSPSIPGITRTAVAKGGRCRVLAVSRPLL